MDAAAEPMRDSDLLLGFALGGDMEHFTILVERYEAELLQVARSVLGDGEAAEDAVQETLLRLVRKALPVAREAAARDSSGRVAPWLFTVLRRLCIDQIRRRKMTVVRPLQAGCDPTVSDAAGAPLAAQDRAGLVWQVVATLPPLERAVVVLRYQEELDYQAIAERIGKTVNHVGVLLHRAVKRLRAAPALREEAVA